MVLVMICDDVDSARVFGKWLGTDNEVVLAVDVVDCLHRVVPLVSTLQLAGKDGRP